MDRLDIEECRKRENANSVANKKNPSTSFQSVNRVYISYSPSMSVAYCFWKYFFQSCGIWVTEKKIDEHWRIDKTKSPQIIILEKQDNQKIQLQECERIVYSVEQMPEVDNKREDIVLFACEEKNYYYNIIHKLFHGLEEEIIYNLLEIFRGENSQQKGANKTGNLWSATWLFHEMVGKKEGRWDSEIYKKCTEVLDALEYRKKDMGDNRNYMFLKLYCKYIQCGIQDRSHLKRMQGCKELIEECSELRNRYGCFPELYTLSGKIRCLSSTENKYSVFDYRSAIQYEKRAALYYDMGVVFEKAYGNMEIAMDCYHKAYACEKMYYPALYKLAQQKERKDNWRTAITFYGEIRSIIENNKVKDSISIQDIEYTFKSLAQVICLCQKNITDRQWEMELQNEINHIHEHIEEYANFDKLMKWMYPEGEAQRKCDEITKELQKRISLR